MFDRFKKSVFGNGDQPTQDERAEPARSAPGGFGRRQTPLNGAAHGDAPPSAPASTGFGRRAAPVADARAQTTTPAAQAVAWLHTARFITTAPRLEHLPALDVPEIAFD